MKKERQILLQSRIPADLYAFAKAEAKKDFSTLANWVRRLIAREAAKAKRLEGAIAKKKA